MLSLFKEKILVGHLEDTVQAIIEYLDRKSVQFELGIKNILKQPSERLRLKKIMKYT